MSSISPCTTCTTNNWENCNECQQEEGPIMMFHPMPQQKPKATLGTAPPAPRGRTPVEAVLLDAIELHLRKSKNYNPGSDIFASFRECEAFGIPAWLNVLARMGEKWSRLKTLAGGVPDLVGESIEDTLMDLSVLSAYAICLYRASVICTAAQKHMEDDVPYHMDDAYRYFDPKYHGGC